MLLWKTIVVKTTVVRVLTILFHIQEKLAEDFIQKKGRNKKGGGYKDVESTKLNNSYADTSRMKKNKVFRSEVCLINGNRRAKFQFRICLFFKHFKVKRAHVIVKIIGLIIRRKKGKLFCVYI